MTNKQIHQLDGAPSLKPADKFLISTAEDNVTKHAQLSQLPFSSSSGGVPRSVTAKLSERISVLDFGAVGDGVTDDSSAFNSALTSGASEIFVPSGTYRTTSTISVGGNTRLVGAGYGSTIILGDHTGAVLKIAEGEYVNSSVIDLGIDMLTGASTGIEVVGHRVILERIWFRHGSPSAWAIDMIDANECVLAHIMAGISGPDKFTANGIRWRNSDPLTNFVNYGDSLIVQPIIRLASSNTTGILFDGGQNGNLVNNVNIERAQINAPQSGAIPLSGTVGLHLKNASRIRVMGTGFEAIEVAVLEESHSNTAGANVGNTYVGVYAINAQTPYQDSNATVSRSVQQRSFLGCDSFPGAVGINDGDSLIPGGLFLSSYNTGTPGICLRSFKPDTALITPDGAPNIELPSRGFLIEATSNNATRISRPQGQSSNVVSRLEIGNGPANSNGGLRDVTIKDPLRLEERSAQLIAPTAGQIVYVKDNSNLVVDSAIFDGPGFYCLLPNASNQTQWRKITSNTD